MLSAMRFRTSVIAAIGEAQALLVQAPPARDEALGALVGIEPDLGFDPHGANGALRASTGSLARQSGIFGEGACQIACGLGPDLIQPVRGFGEGHLLVRQDRQAAVLHPIDIGYCARIALNRGPKVRHLSPRRLLNDGRFRLEAGKDRARRRRSVGNDVATDIALSYARCG